MKRTKFLLILDTLLFLAMAVLLEPRFAGLAIHEWLGLAVLPPIILHILLAWPWIGTLAVRLRAKGAWRLRVNVFLNSLLFVTFVVVAFSGIMTSLIALPAMGISPGNYASWRLLHREWEVYLQVVVGLHIAMNWGWIVGAVRRHVLVRPTAKGEAALAALAERQES